MERMDYRLLLRSHGLRATGPRIAALKEANQAGHITVEELRKHITAQIGSVSTQAVYDIVHVLTEKGLMREVRPVDHAAVYEINLHDDHHHFICNHCGRIQDVPARDVKCELLAPAEKYGFSVEATEVTYWGTCAECRAKMKDGAEPHAVQPQAA